MEQWNRGDFALTSFVLNSDEINTAHACDSFSVSLAHLPVEQDHPNLTEFFFFLRGHDTITQVRKARFPTDVVDLV